MEPNLFAKLKCAAARIDTAVQSLNTKLPAVINSYTYNDPPAAPILARRQTEAAEWNGEMTGWLAEIDRFEQLVGELRAENAEVGAQLSEWAGELGMAGCMVEQKPKMKQVDGDGGASAEMREGVSTTVVVEEDEGEEEEEEEEEDEASPQQRHFDNKENAGTGGIHQQHSENGTDSPNICIARIGGLETPAFQSRRSATIQSKMPVDAQIRRLRFQ